LVRRALVFKKLHKAGTIVRSRDIIVARPIVQVANFINPLDYARVINKTLVKDVQPFEAITYEHIK
ncbi:hypothetical protein, partial [Limnospira fusiformis]|uniref:hypothetical protein n=1 Tax=Limnospira fusiformis TaxID=54297 RepID=UPI0034E094D0